MVCATWIVVALCLLAEGVRPDDVASSEKTSLESDEGRTKRQFRFFGNSGGNQQVFNSIQGRPFTTTRTQFGSSNNNRFAVPVQFSGGSRFITQGQPAFQVQNVQSQSPRQITSPRPFQRQTTTQVTPAILNNDPLGLFRRGSSQGIQTTSTPFNFGGGNLQRLQLQSNRVIPTQGNIFQRSPQNIVTPQQIVNFQRQQQQRTLAPFQGNSQSFRFPQQNFNFQRFSPAAFQGNQAFTPNQQFRPSFQVSQTNRFQPNQFRQSQTQSFQNPQTISFLQQQRPQTNFIVRQPQQLQQTFQRPQQQQFLQQLLQRQQAVNQRQQPQVQTQQPQVQRQQPQVQRQQPQAQRQQPQVQRQQPQAQRQQPQVQRQQPQVQRQQPQAQRQQTQPTAASRPTSTAQTSFGVPLTTNRQPTRQPTQRPTQAAPQITRQPSRPTTIARPVASAQSSFGRPLQTTSQPARPTSNTLQTTRQPARRPVTIARPTVNTQTSFGRPLQTTATPRPTVNTQTSFGRPLQTTTIARPTANAQASFGRPLQTTTIARPTANAQASFRRPLQTTAASFGVPFQATRRPTQTTTSARPSAQQQFAQALRQQVQRQQLQRQPGQRPGVLLSQTSPQTSVSQTQTFSRGSSLGNTASQIFQQRGRPSVAVPNGGFRIVVDNTREDNTLENFTDELFDSRELRFSSGIRTGTRTGIRTGTRAGTRTGTGLGSLGQTVSLLQNRGVINRPTAPRFQLRPDLTTEDFTIEVDSRERFSPNILRSTGNFRSSFGTRFPGLVVDLTTEDLTIENFTDERDTFELFDD